MDAADDAEVGSSFLCSGSLKKKTTEMRFRLQRVEIQKITRAKQHPKNREKPGFCARWVQSGGIRELNGWRERSWAQSGREERREEGRFPRGGCQMFFFLRPQLCFSSHGDGEKERAPRPHQNE